MKKTYLITTLSIALVLIMLVSSSYARRHHDGHGPNLGMLYEELKLTDEQMSKIKDIHVETERELIDLKAELKKARMEKHELFDSQIPSENEVNKHINEISDIREKMEKTRAASRIEVLKVLTNEQFAELSKLKTKHFFDRKQRDSFKGRGDCHHGHFRGCRGHGHGYGMRGNPECKGKGI